MSKRMGWAIILGSFAALIAVLTTWFVTMIGHPVIGLLSGLALGIIPPYLFISEAIMPLFEERDAWHKAYLFKGGDRL